jgi:hypothetical protein
MKFTDPNYNTLKTYFDILKNPRSSDANSYLMTWRTPIVVRGGVYTPLYQLKDNGDFVGYKFIIEEVDGDNFVFSYSGILSTHSEATELEVGKEMYFRKDAFFRDWLNVNSDTYANFVNANKTFIYFGKIYELSNSASRYFIKFEGLKNWIMECLPQHNRTEKLTELLNVSFDQVYHEPYNMLKNVFSFFDPKEVQLKHLYYLADKFGVSIDVDLLSEIVLREWVDSLINLLKRKGTYTSYYIIFKLLFSNTRNKLNIYERWLELCHQDIFGDTTSEGYFEDHHILEHYGIHPSGGSGDLWYASYDPDNYPAPTIIPPWQNSTYTCGSDYLSLGSSSFTIYDDSSRLASQDDNSIIVHGLVPDEDTFYASRSWFSRSVAHGGFRYCFRFYVSSTTTLGGSVFIWTIANTGSNMWQNLDDPVGLYLNVSLANNLRVGLRVGETTQYLVDGQTGEADKVIEFDTWYYVTVNSYSNLDFGVDEETYVKAEVFTSNNRLPSEKVATGTLDYDGLSRDYLLMVTHTRDAAFISWYFHVAYLQYLNESNVCSKKELTCSTPLDLSEFIGVDTGNNIISQSSDMIEVEDFDPDTDTMYLYKSLTTLGRIYGGFKHCFTFFIPSSNTGSGKIYIWLQSNETEEVFDTMTTGYGFYIDNFLSLRCGLSSPSISKSIGTIKENVYYYVSIYTEDMDENYIAVDIYDSPERKSENLILSGNIAHDGATRNYLYVLNQGPLFSGSHDIIISDYYTNFTATESVAASGNLFLSPHYKVEIDLSTEPMEEGSIISENYSKELIRYWEYMKPVSKFVDYHYVLAPLAIIDDFNEYRELYENSIVGYCDTKFTGSFFVSGGTAPPSIDYGESTYVYRQGTSKSEWKIVHNLGTSDVLIQVYNEFNEIIYMDTVQVLNTNTVILTFDTAVRGSAFVAGLKSWNVLHNQTSETDPWTINHNMGTDEGALNYVFDIYNLSRTEYLVPDSIERTSTDQIVVTWSTTGKSIVKSGRMPIRDEDYIHTQAVASTTWTINHNLNAAGFIVEVWDSDDKYIFPKTIKHTNSNTTTIYFSEAVAGTAVLVYFQREFENEEIVNTILGSGAYWMIGDEDSDTFRPEVSNYLNSPTTSGAILDENVIEYSDKYIINFTIPTGEEYSIKEIGIFNGEGNIMFYTRCSEVFKPENVQLDLHYRIDKQ